MKTCASLTLAVVLRAGTLLGASATIFSVSAAGQQAPGAKLVFNHVSLSVKDLDASADFYGRILNLREIFREVPTKGVRWFSLGEGKELHLISPEHFKGDHVVVNKAVHLALTTDNFAELLKVLDAHQVAYGDWKGTLRQVDMRSDGVKQVFLQDPDGYLIEINSAGEK
jgi:lactoylglutathione lyase